MKNNELREIDAVIAVKLFGFQWVRFPRRDNPELVTLSEPKWAAERIAKGYAVLVDNVSVRTPRYDDWVRYVPEFSTDITYAIKAVEKLRKHWKANSVKRVIHCTQHLESGWFVDIEEVSDSMRTSNKVIVSRFEENLATAIAWCIVKVLDESEGKQND